MFKLFNHGTSTNYLLNYSILGISFYVFFIQPGGLTLFNSSGNEFTPEKHVISPFEQSEMINASFVPSLSFNRNQKGKPEIKKENLNKEKIYTFLPSLKTVHDKKGNEESQKVNLYSGYSQRFAPIAEQEMKKYGIPASIILAQGMIESNGGLSTISTQNNNHFGIKCFSKKCKKGHCSNFTDDSHKDFFRKYHSAWESFREHSKLLSVGKYSKLHRLGPTDYKSWAKGLQEAGYATDPGYSAKLIFWIEKLGLDRYDA